MVIRAKSRKGSESVPLKASLPVLQLLLLIAVVIVSFRNQVKVAQPWANSNNSVELVSSRNQVKVILPLENTTNSSEFKSSALKLRNTINGTVTATVVTCNRLGFTIKTLDSLFRTMWGDRDLFSDKVIVIMDCYNSTFESTLSDRYGDGILLVNSSYIGKQHIPPQSKAIWNQVDALKMVRTQYWLAMEEDWEWIAPGFFPSAMKVLEEDPIPWMVIGRGANTFRPYVNESRGWNEVTVKERTESYGYLGQAAGSNGEFGCYTANSALHRTDTALKFLGNAKNFSYEGYLSRHLCHTQGINSSIAIFKKRFYKHLGGEVSAIRNGDEQMHNKIPLNPVQEPW